MIRRHLMPFGAQVKQDNSVRFRLWAPNASTVDVILDDGGRKSSIRMHAAGGGWFEAEPDTAQSGDLYRFLIDGRLEVPDPASRCNPLDVHGPSRVVDPADFEWNDLEWKGRPWREAVLYELHVGTFTPEGTFRGVIQRLDYLAGLGITALELMPVSDFPGSRNWGYDGVLPYAPDSSYGTPDDLKSLIQACHQKGLMILLDVVYNHFGPEGNYLHTYAPEFFTDRHKTPWGNAINFDGHGSRVVRDFFIHNALYWLEEFRFDGLRLDAVHSIVDESEPHILYELAEAVHKGPGCERFCHLVLENEKNNACYLAGNGIGISASYSAQWNDDWHHAAHVLATGEHDGYYSDFSDQPIRFLGRCLAEGFAFQGESSAYHGRTRGERSTGLSSTAFVNFLQNHDQIGNRALGERLNCLAEPAALAALSAILLLAPSPPMFFMGEEYGSDRPFLYFCDFEPELADAVSRGRRREFAGFRQFAGSDLRQVIPDPGDQATFNASKLDWEKADPETNSVLLRNRQLLDIRRRRILPLLEQDLCCKAEFRICGDRGIAVEWHMANRSRLHLLANLGQAPLDQQAGPKGEIIYSVGEFPNPWSVLWSIEG